MAAILQIAFSNVKTLNENYLIPMQISLKFVPMALDNNNPALIQIMAQCQKVPSH